MNQIQMIGMKEQLNIFKIKLQYFIFMENYDYEEFIKYEKHK